MPALLLSALLAEKLRPRPRPWRHGSFFCEAVAASTQRMEVPQKEIAKQEQLFRSHSKQLRPLALHNLQFSILLLLISQHAPKIRPTVQQPEGPFHMAEGLTWSNWKLADYQWTVTAVVVGFVQLWSKSKRSSLWLGAAGDAAGAAVIERSKSCTSGEGAAVIEKSKS